MILAAGRGTRLRPLTERIPKCMVPVGGKPILEHTIEWLQRYGVTDLVINLCHLPDVVMNHFGDGSRWGVQITYSLEKEPLGTAGGVRNVAWFFEGPFFVWYGDNLSTCRLDRLYAFHKTKGGVATIALHYRENPTASGIVGLDENDRITRFLEKPRPDQIFSHWVNAGIFLLEPTVLKAIPVDGAPDFGRDIFTALLAAGQRLYGYRMSANEDLWWIDTPEDLRRVQEIDRTQMPQMDTDSRKTK
ncbi:MAG: nucleotidyltransferase family protein [Anaerolineae bacterium]|jgi:NDP-sugar pyrophosphorylase family protein|nr:nucleotidyltransferase family protein [Anaerolineae bacterium]